MTDDDSSGPFPYVTADEATDCRFDPRQGHANLAHWFVHRRCELGDGDRVALRVDVEGAQGTGTSSVVTYDQLADRVRRVASMLETRGLRCEERVLLAIPDGVEMAQSILGVVHAGAVAVMINPELDQDLLQHLLDESRARLVLTTTALRQRLEACERRFLLDVLYWDDPATQAAFERAEPRPEPFASHPDDAAIWLFSGGTTGRPKAVVQSHQSFVHTTRRYAHGVLGLNEGDVTLSVPKLHFGYATGSNLLFPLSVGASAVLFPERCTAQRLFELIERHRPTILINVPTMIGKMLSGEGVEQRDLSCLRLVTSAGEALPEELDRRWRETFGAPILDGLGTAEMWHVFLTNHPGDVHPGTLGRAVEGFDVEVRGDDGLPLADGQVGWLWVRGDSRAHGYWQRRERSRQSFRGEWVVTGDMVRRDASGVFTYCGRGDDMVKVSGKWLWPKEVENCLLGHPAVREAAVLGVEDAAGLVKPWAFVLLQEAAENAESDDSAATSRSVAEQLRQHALACLEPYKAPREVRVLDDFPRTHLGKVDRGSLRRLARGE